MNIIYDVVIIGGGISGIVTANLYKKISPQSKVLIIEKNKYLGGLAGTEKINGYFFDSVYLFPDISKFLKHLSIDYKFYKYDDKVFRFINADEDNKWSMDIPYRTYKLIDYFTKKFPKESKNISKFFNKSLKINKQFSNLKTKFNFIDILKLFFCSNLLLFNLNKNLKDYLKSFNFKDNNLIRVLSALSGLANLPPEELNALISIVGFSSLQKGAYRQKNNFNEFINKLVNKLNELKIETKLNNELIKIESENKTFKLILKNNEIFYSKKIISTINTFNIFQNILSKEIIPVGYLNKINNLIFSHSAFIIRLIVKNYSIKYPVDIGQMLFYKGDNAFSFLYELANKNQCILNSDKFHFALAVREQKEKKCYSIELLSIPVSYDYWKNIFNKNKLLYKKEIKKWENFFIEKLEKHFDKNIKRKIILKKTFTPIDLEKNFNLYKGTIYDMSYIKSQSGINRIMFKTPIKNFYHLKTVHGIYGSIFQSFLLVDYLSNGKINNYRYRYD